MESLFIPGATRIVYSDASDSGYGGYMVKLGPDIAHGQWSVAEALLHSLGRSLALKEKSFAQKLAGHTVKWFTDNQGVVSIWFKEGSSTGRSNGNLPPLFST